MTERERVARLLHQAHITWRVPLLLAWEDAPEVHAVYLVMADAVLADRRAYMTRVQEALARVAEGTG